MKYSLRFFVAKNIFSGFVINMKISLVQPYNYSFGTNAHTYTNEENKYRCSLTYLFRSDLEWKNFTDYMVNHFRNKDKINFIQFAASDGSEAYSQIITLLENHKNNEKFFPIQAYDIDKQVINAANSGILNINIEDKGRILRNGYDFIKYFKATDNEVFMDDDAFSKYYDISDDFKHLATSSYEVSKELTSRVNFHNADMYDVLKELDDNSNTVLMCRNIIGYFTEYETESFIELVSKKLKRDSLFIVGEYDTRPKRIFDLDLILQHKGFVPVMENVYRKAY